MIGGGTFDELVYDLVRCVKEELAASRGCSKIAADIDGPSEHGLAPLITLSVEFMDPTKIETA